MNNNFTISQWMDEINEKLSKLIIVCQSNITNSMIAGRIIDKSIKCQDFLKRYEKLRDLEATFLIAWSILNELQVELMDIDLNQCTISLKRTSKVINCKEYTIKTALLNNKEIYLYKKISYESEFIKKSALKQTNFQFQLFLIESKIFYDVEQIFFAYIAAHRNQLDITHSNSGRIKNKNLYLSKKNYSVSYITKEMEYIFNIVNFIISILNYNTFHMNIIINNLKIESHFIVGTIVDKKIVGKEESKNIYYNFIIEPTSSYKQPQRVKITTKNKEMFDLFVVGELVKVFINFNLNGEFNNINAWKILKIITEEDISKPIAI